MENKIKHLVITRFLCNPFMNLGNKVFDKDMIDTGIFLLKTYLLTSLQKQSNKNFEWIILIHENTNKKYLQPLFDIHEDFEIKFITVYNNSKNTDILFNELTQYCQECYENCDWLITSRIDYDDMIYYNAINDIQTNIQYNNPLYIYAYKNYCEHNIKVNTYLNKINPFEKKGGAMSILLTLVENTKKVNKALNIYNMGNHTKCSECIKNNYRQYGIDNIDYDIIVFNEFNEVSPLIYTIHDNNDSNKMEKSLQSKNVVTTFNYNKFFNSDKIL